MVKKEGENGRENKGRKKEIWEKKIKLRKKEEKKKRKLQKTVKIFGNFYKIHAFHNDIFQKIAQQEI